MPNFGRQTDFFVESGSLEASDQKVPEFIRLLTSHQARLRAFAFSLIPHWADAEEVLQEASLVMFRKFDQFQVGTNFFSWACKVIHLTAKDFRKRQARHKVRFGDAFLEAVAQQTIEMEEELGERERLLSDCVAQLKAKHRQMLQLRYEQGRKIEEIASILGSTAKAIYQALSRVHKALLECVERRLAAARSV